MTLCGGASSGLPSALPMMNSPPGRKIISTPERVDDLDAAEVPGRWARSCVSMAARQRKRAQSQHAQELGFDKSGLTAVWIGDSGSLSCRERVQW